MRDGNRQRTRVRSARHPLGQASISGGIRHRRIHMDANQDILLGEWPALKGQVKLRWGKLTDGDVQRLSGKTEELTGILQQRYGYGKVQAEMEINQWVSVHDPLP